jgi:hypothetical protein
MKEAAIAPPGVMPSQQPIAADRSSVHQYFGRLFHTLQTTLRLMRAEWPRSGQALLHREQDLADAEEADHRHEEVHPAHQRLGAEGHPQLAGRPCPCRCRRGSGPAPWR